MSPNTSVDASKPENPNEFLEIPKWINEDYFRPIIEKDVKDFAKITKFVTIAATQPGDNFTSIMVRVIVDIELKDGSEKKLSYILKTMLESEKGGDLVSGMGLFPKEKEMYEVHLPHFVKLYKDAGVDVELSPKCVHIEDNSKGITIVLEDLKEQKFENFDRLKGFDMEHMSRTLNKIAEFHAASVVAYEQNGPFDPMFYKSFFTEENRATFEGLMEMQNDQILGVMKKWDIPDLDYYISKYPQPKDYFDRALKLNKVDENEFNCLNHGDTWSNNIMFSGDRTLFVDFQVGKWGSPAQDLWYLIISSAAMDIRVKEFDRFIQIYHTRLVECLKLLKYSKHIPTLREMHIMMMKYGDFALLTSSGVLMVVVMPPDKDFNMNNLMAPGPEGDAVRNKAYSNPGYVKAMGQLLPFMDNKGLL